MESSVYHIKLLLSCEIDELHCIAGYADGEIRIFGFIRMLHDIKQCLPAEDVHIQVMRTLAEIAVHGAYQILYTLVLIMAESRRVHGLGV